MATTISSAQAQRPADPLAAGRQQLADNRFADALSSFQEAARRDSSNVTVWRGMAIALHRLERYPEALSVLDRALALAPGDFVVRYSRGLALAELGRFAEAVAEFDSALVLRPGFAPALTERGSARLSLGQIAGAREDFGRSLAADSNYIWPRYYRGIAGIAAGNYTEAIVDFDAVVAKEGLLSAQLWRWVAYRLGARSAPAIAGRDTAWPGPVAAFLRDEISAPQLVDEARRARLPIDDRRLASAYFFIAQKHLALGDVSQGRSSLDRALGLPVPAHAELIVGQAQLLRIERGERIPSGR